MATNIQQYNVAKAMYRRSNGGLTTSLNDSANTKMEFVPLDVSGTVYGSISLQPVNSATTRRITIENLASNAGFAISRAWQTHSSRRWKHDIRRIADGLSIIARLEPSNFKWNDDPTNKEDAGFIAEEITNVMPFATAYDEEGQPIGVDLTRIIPYLVAAVQQQQAQIEALTKQIELLSSNTEGL